MHLLYIGLTARLWPIPSTSFRLVVTLRFSSNVADSSDIARVLQNRALVEFFFDAPFFGHGLENYSTQIIRSIDLPYSYESQVLALCGQVSIGGILLFVFLLLNYYRKSISVERGNYIYQFSVLLLLIDFIAAGFFNPYLLSSTAAASLGMIFALFKFVPKNEPTGTVAA